MSKNKITIIGAGIAGLSAGNYLQINGYDTKIYELHDMPGGLCTSWKRKGYTLDGCIHSIGGLNPKFHLYHYWNEIIDLSELKYFHHETLGNVEYKNGKKATIFTDSDKLKRELLSIAPEDEKFINGFIKAVEKLEKRDLSPKKPLELWTPIDYFLSQFRVGSVLYQLTKWRKSLEDMTKKCENPFLKRVLYMDFFSRYPAYFIIMSLGHCHKRNSGYTIGGSLSFARLFEKRYLELGGKIHYKSKVIKINTKNNQAIGVTLENGEVHNDADIVLSAADGYYTIFKMLDGKYINEKIKKLYDEHPRWPSMILISLGLSRTFEKEPTSIELHLEKEFIVDEKSKLDSVPIIIYNFDSTLAPKGKTCMRVILHTDNYQYWNDLRINDVDKYKQEKERISKEVIKILDKRFRDISNNVEVIDVATPATFKRYTNNWMGSTQGWNWGPKLIPEFISKELPGLKNFYMIGQWTIPGGGVSTAFTSGRDITQIICKNDNRNFRTS